MSSLKSVFSNAGILIGTLVLLASQCRATNQKESAETFSKLYTAVEAIRVHCHVPTGFDMAISDPDNTPITLVLDCHDLASDFDQIVAQRSVYKWSMEDGVYDLYPKSRDEQLSGLRVKIFVIQDATRIQALVALDTLPEVQKWRSLHREEGGILISDGFPQMQRRASITFHNTSLRKILNWLSMNLGSNPQEPQWSLVPYGEVTKHLNIAF